MGKNAFSMQRMRENARIKPMREGNGWKRKALFHFCSAGGGLPLLLFYKAVLAKIKVRSQSSNGLRPYALQWLLVAGGVVLGIVFFHRVAG